MKKTTTFFVLTMLISIGLFAQKNIQFRSNLQYPGSKASNIWGYTDSAGIEYAIVGLDTGVSIVNVHNPDSVYEVQFVPGPRSIWREMKTWKHYAYVTNETGRGLLCIDLAGLPSHVDTTWWTADTIRLATVHTDFVDENGFLYLNGYNNMAHSLSTSQRGILIADLNVDPMHPSYVGKFDKQYVHDCFVRNDTLWAAEIYVGGFEVMDIHDKTHLVSIGSHSTPSNFTHNLWLSDNNKTLFTTDERSAAYITSYDVSDLNNITELCRYQSHPGSGNIPHNVYFQNNYAIASYYKDGIVILDVTDPTNMIEMGNFDTSPLPPGDGYGGCWGVYPFFHSGILIASDIEEGLFVLAPSYYRAAYVRGTVTNSAGAPLGNINVEVVGTEHNTISNSDGTYRTGVDHNDNYDIRFWGTGCPTHIVGNIALTAGDTVIVNWQMECLKTGIGDPGNDEAFLYAFDNNNGLYINFRTPDDMPTGTRLSIYDLTGKLLHTWNLVDHEGQLELNLPLSHSMYVIQMQNGNKLLTTKAIH